MKNYYLNLSILPLDLETDLREKFLSQPSNTEQLDKDLNWLYRMSLTQSKIKNIECSLKCFYKLLDQNIDIHLKQHVKIGDSIWALNKQDATELAKHFDNFITNNMIQIKSDLSNLIYTFEIKTVDEIVKEFEQHLKIMKEYIKTIDDGTLLVVSKHNMA